MKPDAFTKRYQEFMNILSNNKTLSTMNDKNKNNNPTGGAVYGLGLIGAAIYFISTATSFWLGVLGFLKAIVWPVFLILEAFKYLGS